MEFLNNLLHWRLQHRASLGLFLLGILLGFSFTRLRDLIPIPGVAAQNHPRFSAPHFGHEGKNGQRFSPKSNNSEATYDDAPIDIGQLSTDFRTGRNSEAKMRIQLYNFGLRGSVQEAQKLLTSLVDQGIPSDIYISLIEGQLERSLVDGAHLIGELTKADNIIAIPKDLLRLSAATYAKLLSERELTHANNLAQRLEKFQITTAHLNKWSVVLDIQDLSLEEIGKISSDSLNLSTDDVLQVAAEMAKTRGFDALKKVAELRIADSKNGNQTRISRAAANLAEANPLHAWRWVNDLPSGGERGLAANGVIAIIANKTPDRAIEFAAGFEGTHEDRINLLLGLRVGFEQRGDGELVEQVSELIESEELAIKQAHKSN